VPVFWRRFIPHLLWCEIITPQSPPILFNDQSPPNRTRPDGAEGCWDVAAWRGGHVLVTETLTSGSFVTGVYSFFKRKIAFRIVRK
jgi:hypothetical protein